MKAHYFQFDTFIPSSIAQTLNFANFKFKVWYKKNFFGFGLCKCTQLYLKVTGLLNSNFECECQNTSVGIICIKIAWKRKVPSPKMKLALRLDVILHDWNNQWMMQNTNFQKGRNCKFLMMIYKMQLLWQNGLEDKAIIISIIHNYMC